MSEIKIGRRYRVVETYQGGTVTYEGVASEVDSECVSFAGHVPPAWFDDMPTEAGGVTVTVEEIRDPLPTAHGSLIRYYPSGREHLDVNVIQMRIPTERMTTHDQGQPVRWENFNWITATSGLRVTDPTGDFDVIFDAGATS